MKGKLPAGWKSRKLGDLVEFFYGYPFDSSKFNDERRGHPVIRIRDLLNHSTKTFYDGEFDRSYLINEGDILIGMDGEFNIVRWKGTSALLNQRNCKLKIKSDEILDGYLFRVLIKILKDIEGATPFVTVKHLSAKQLNSIYLPLPPLPVQRQIVAVLEQAEAVKGQRQEADALTGALLQSVFYEMFGDPVRNERGWEVIQLDDACPLIRDGEHRTPEYIDEGIPFITAKNLVGNRINFENTDKISPEEHIEFSRRAKPEMGDLLMTKDGTIGVTQVVKEDIEFSIYVSVVLLKLNHEMIHPDFLNYLLSSAEIQNEIRKRTKGIAIRHIHLVDLRSLKIPLPPLALQQQFARVVQDVERIREQQVASGKEIEGLCEGLMQRAFAGELVA